MIELSIILPVCNEEESIEKFIKSISNLIKQQKIVFEIIAVENGSTDNTLKVLQGVSKKNKLIKIFQSEKGWGNAVKQGIKNSKGKYICYMVSNGQIDPKYILSLFYEIKKRNVGMIKLYRSNRENITRLLNSKAYNFLAMLLFRVNSRDINATPKIILAKYIKENKFFSHNIAFDLELLIYLNQKQIPWIEVKGFSKKRKFGKSKTSLKSVWEMLSYMFGFYISLRKRHG